MPASNEPGGPGRPDRSPGDRNAGPTSQRAARRQRRLADNGGGRLSRPLAVALIVIVAGGAYLFWPRGGGAPAGIGERITVITADSLVAPAPRSGSVDIESEMQPLIAERPADKPAAAPAPTPTQPPTTPTTASRQSTTPPASASASTATTSPQLPPSSPTTTRIQPRPTGGWAVQVGAYGQEPNADRLAGQLREKGFDAQVRAASTATGDLIYRVWIGWFANRDQALAFARQERDRIGEAHPVHR